MGKLPTQRGSDWPRLWSGLGRGLGFRLARALPENVGLCQVEGKPPARSPPIFRDRALLRMCSSRARSSWSCESTETAAKHLAQRRRATCAAHRRVQILPQKGPLHGFGGLV